MTSSGDTVPAQSFFSSFGDLVMKDRRVIFDLYNINAEMLRELWIYFRLTDETSLKLYPNVSHLKSTLTSETLLILSEYYNELLSSYHKLLNVNKGMIMVIPYISEANKESGFVVTKVNNDFTTAFMQDAACKGLLANYIENQKYIDNNIQMFESGGAQVKYNPRIHMVIEWL
jgi:hypothetical protein